MSGLLALAIGRVVRGSGVSDILVEHFNVRDSRGDHIKQTCKSVMSQSHRIKCGTGVQLDADGKNYRVHADRMELSGCDIVFFCITDLTFDRQFAKGSLKDLKELTRSFNDAALAGSPAAEIGRQLKDRVADIAAKAPQTDKIAVVNSQIDQVKAVVQDNIALTIERGGKLEDLEVKTETLEQHAMEFSKNATEVKKFFCRQYIKYTICLALIVIIILVSVLASVLPKK